MLPSSPFSLQQAFAQALQHHGAGRLDAAEALYREILAAQPDHAEACHHLGLIAHQRGEQELAAQWIQRSLAFAPRNGIALANLGEVQRVAGHLEEAAGTLQRALQVDPFDAAGYYNLGNVLRDQGHSLDAILAFRRAAGLKPAYAEAYNNMAVVLKAEGHLEEALAAFRQALAVEPAYIEARYNLGNTLQLLGRPEAAVAAYRQVLELQPRHLDAHNNLGNVFFRQGRVAEAIEAFRRAAEINPQDATAQSNIVFSHLYLPGSTAESLAVEQARWRQSFAEPLRPSIPPHPNDRDPERRLRIGYVSSDFRSHVVGRCLKPLFERHDHQQFEIFCYSGVKRPDEMTSLLRAKVEHWRDTVGLADDALAEMIRRDEVDILVDLAQHTAQNRLPIFARQPAPVQVSLIGTTDTAGLETISWRITDRYLAPEQPAAPWEQLGLIESNWCYDPCGITLPVNVLPAGPSGSMTFGSLNNYCKVNEPLLRLWARVLHAVEGSRLVLRCDEGSHRQRAVEVLGGEGVVPERIEFLDPAPDHRGYLEMYHRLDIALDTFPYTGHITSLDALWMGVPVVSLVGSQPVGRVGWSQLSLLGLPELAAFSEEQYVAIAAHLAGDRPRLAELRATLRERMEASPLMDAAGYTRNVEGAFRHTWREWCAH